MRIMAEKRIVVIWIVSGCIMGSFIAILFEAVKKNPWLLLLTVIATRAPHVDGGR